MLDLDKVMRWPFPRIEQAIGLKDCLLYALSLGYGRDPMDESDLRFVYEENLRVVPSLGSVLARPALWARDPATGIAWTKIVHGEQGMVFHRPIPSQGTIVGQMKVVGVEDKGPGAGALVFLENHLTLKETGEPIITIASTSFCRGDGGCGSDGQKGQPVEPVPQRAADTVVELKTEPGQALLYRLNGDYNPLHASPEAARKAGFDRPILHGLCTYGMACRGILAACCDNDPSALASLRARFTAPVMPGETLRLLVWREPEAIRFESRVLERDKVVLGAGIATLH